MLYKNLGNTQFKISSIGQGSIGAGSYQNATAERIKQRIDILRFGIELGVTFFDTGEDYEDGHAEEVLGDALRGFRDRVCISSKFRPSNNSFKGVINSIEGSLKRLKTDYIDLYQVQWPNFTIPISETMSALSRLLKEGKIRFVGVSNFMLSQLKEAQSALGIEKIAAIQTEYNLYNRAIELDLLPHCVKNQTTVIAYSPLNQGTLSFNDSEKEVLNLISEKHKVNVFQVILNWVISHSGVIALTRTMNMNHLKESVIATDFNLDITDINQINETFKRDPVLVPTRRIRVVDYDIDESHRIYSTLEEAIENRYDLQPSPAALAQEIKTDSLLKPVELVSTKDRSGLYDYDLLHGRIRYWAWIIAYSHDMPIPAYIIRG